MKNIVDLTNYFQKAPTLQEVKDFLNKSVFEGKKYATLSPDWIVDIPITSKKKDHIAKSSQFKFMNKSQKKRHNKYILAIEDLLASAIYTGQSQNNKPLEKPNIVKYHYFKTEVKINDKLYNVIIDTEEYVGDITTKPRVVHLYDITEK